jgi:hypothetical protein
MLSPIAPAAPQPTRAFVAFSTPKRWNLLSWAIRKASFSKASHAFLLVDDPVFRLRLVMEAHSTGFRLVTLARFARTNRIVSVIVPAHRLDAGLPRAGSFLGEAFDTLGILGMAWVLLRRLLHLAPGRSPLHSPTALFCSEAVVRTLKAAGFPGAEALGNEDSTPEDVRRFLLDTGGIEIAAAALDLRRRAGPRRGRAVPPSPAPARSADRAAS